MAGRNPGRNPRESPVSLSLSLILLPILFLFLVLVLFLISLLFLVLVLGSRLSGLGSRLSALGFAVAALALSSGAITTSYLRRSSRGLSRRASLQLYDSFFCLLFAVHCRSHSQMTHGRGLSPGFPGFSRCLLWQQWVLDAVLATPADVFTAFRLFYDDG